MRSGWLIPHGGMLCQPYQVPLSCSLVKQVLEFGIYSPIMLGMFTTSSDPLHR